MSGFLRGPPGLTSISLRYSRHKLLAQSISTKNPAIAGFLLWSHLGSNQGPPDYESGALTN